LLRDLVGEEACVHDARTTHSMGPMSPGQDKLPPL